MTRVRVGDASVLLPSRTVAQAIRVRIADGQAVTVAARVFGFSSQTAHRLLNPSFAERGRVASRAVKAARPRTPCAGGCGRVVIVGAHNSTTGYCAHCASGVFHLVWTRERIIDAIVAYERLFGEPPTGSAWNPPDWKRLPYRGRVYADRWARGRWPFTSCVQARFGSWNAAITAAGFEPLPASGGWRERELRQLRELASA